MSRFFRNFITLLIAPVIFISLLAGWVLFTQPELKQNGLTVFVRDPVVLPWENAVVDLQLTPAVNSSTLVGANPVVFLVDTSGSMADDNLEQAKFALVEFVKNISGSSDNSLSIVFFDDEAKTILPLTNDYHLVSTAIDEGMIYVGGNTDFVVGLRHVLKLLAGNQIGTVVMLTDGAARESDETLAQFYNDYWKPSGNELYLLGVGSHIVKSKFLALTDNPGQYVVTRYTPTAITDILIDAAERIGNIYAVEADFYTPFDEALVIPSLDEEESFKYRIPGIYNPEKQRFDLPVIFNVQQNWSLPLEPQLAGILSVFAEPMALSYSIPNSGSNRYLIEDSPKILSITWWFLFFLFLPAALYLLSWMIQRLSMRSASPIPDPNLSFRSSMVFPSALELPVKGICNPVSWSPALVIGLGGSGREVLSEIQQELQDSYDSAETRPVLLSLDLASQDAVAYRDSEGGAYLEKLPENNIFVLPAESTQLKDDIKHNPNLFGLDLEDYKNVSSDLLNLEMGSQKNPVLSRLALLKELSQGESSQLYQRLQKAIVELRQKLTQDNAQLILVANTEGGVGRGWLVPLSIILRKMLQDSFGDGTAIEMSILLIGEKNIQKSKFVPLRCPELMSEIDLISNAGKIKVPYLLGHPSRPFVSGVTSKPWDNIFITPYTDWRDGCVRAAQCTTFLLDKPIRTSLSHTLQSISGKEAELRAATGAESFVGLNISTVSFPGSFFRHMVLFHTIKVLIENNILLPKLKFENGTFQLPYDETVLANLFSIVKKPTNHEWHLTLAIAEPARNLVARTGNEDLLSQIQECRVALFAAINQMLLDRSLSIFELPAVCDSVVSKLVKLKANLGDEVEDLEQSFAALKNQAVEWIEVMMGSDFVQDNFESRQEKDNSLRGLLQHIEQKQNVLNTKLREWQNASSRNISLWQESENNPLETLQNFVERHYSEIFTAWTNEELGSVKALNERFVWQLNSPGINGQTVSLNFSIYSTNVFRYSVSDKILDSILNDLNDEISRFTHSGRIQHIMQHFLERNMSDSEMHGFAQQMKGDIEGINEQILVSLPFFDKSVSELDVISSKFKDIFENKLAGAAEKIRVCDGDAVNHMGLIRLEPFLRSKKNHVSADQICFNHQIKLEKLITKYCHDTEIQSLNLPLCLALALEESNLVKKFCDALSKQMVWRDALSMLWCFYDGRRQIELTIFEQDTLAEAIAIYVLEYADRDFMRSDAEKADVTAEDEEIIEFLSWYVKGAEQ